MATIVDFIDEVLNNPKDDTVIENVKNKVNALMGDKELFNT